MRPYDGPPGELWLSPRRRRGTLLGLVIIAVLAVITLAAGYRIGLATVAGSSCGGAEACPTGWTCDRGRCNPPPPPPRRVHVRPEEMGHAG